MDLAQFFDKRRERRLAEPQYRTLCAKCVQPDFSCYCGWLKPFDAKMEFVILKFDGNRAD
jgi:DTW domain-containing protein YfiP